MNEIKNEIEWLEARQHGIGSTASPVLALGKIFNKTPIDLYLEKKQEIRPRTDDNMHFRRGHTYEPLACALFEAQEGVKVHAPRNDFERYNVFMLWHPDIDCMYTDLDGFTEDGWIVEVKAPMQRTCDKYRTTGIPANYQIQGQHHICVARAAGLPFTGMKGDEIKGVVFVIYEPEVVQLQIVRVPVDEDMISAIEANAKYFWEEHVIPGEPPIEPDIPQPIKAKGKGGTYVHISGEAWKTSVAEWKMAKEILTVAENRIKATEKTIRDAMESSDLDAVVTDDGYKFSNKEQAGRKALDLTALQVAYPNINLADFQKQGKPFRSFRKYGPKNATSDATKKAAEEMGTGSMDNQLMTLRDELDVFTGANSFTPEEAMETFDELRDRADLYSRLLSVEIKGIENSLVLAADSVNEKVKG